MSERLGRAEWRLAYQSRSGPPEQDWLEPDIADSLHSLADGGASRDVVVAPIGFVYENMEIVYDLDVQAHQLGEGLGLNLVRAALVGSHRRFAEMIRELVVERDGSQTRPGRPWGRTVPRPIAAQRSKVDCRWRTGAANCPVFLSSNAGRFPGLSAGRRAFSAFLVESCRIALDRRDELQVFNPLLFANIFLISSPSSSWLSRQWFVRRPCTAFGSKGESC